MKRVSIDGGFYVVRIILYQGDSKPLYKLRICISAIYSSRKDQAESFVRLLNRLGRCEEGVNEPLSRRIERNILGGNR